MSADTGTMGTMGTSADGDHAQNAVGDRGQRYEVRYADAETGKEKVMGWTDKADGGGLMRVAQKWPAVKERSDGTRVAWLVDRHTGEIVGRGVPS